MWLSFGLIFCLFQRLVFLIIKRVVVVKHGLKKRRLKRPSFAYYQNIRENRKKSKQRTVRVKNPFRERKSIGACDMSLRNMCVHSPRQRRSEGGGRGATVLIFWNHTFEIEIFLEISFCVTVLNIQYIIGTSFSIILSGVLVFQIVYVYLNYNPS